MSETETTRAGRADLGKAATKNFNYGKSWFLGIGINDYQHFSPLHNAVKDIQDIVAVLLEEYDLDEENAILILNEEATEDNIIRGLEDLISKVEADDKLLIYYSGHGHLNPRTKRGAWIPVDAALDSPSDYIRNSTIKDYIKDISSFHTLLISDACFSGSLLVKGSTRSSFTHLEEAEQMRSRWAICSGRNTEEVSDGDKGENSPFTASILKTLRSNKDSMYNVAKMAERVMELTRGKYNQLPMYSPLVDSGHEGGQYIFKRNLDEEQYWLISSQANTFQAYSDYLALFPKGEHAQAATKAIRMLQDDEAWLKFSRLNTAKSYEKYLARFPKGQFSNPARKLIRKSGPKLNRPTSAKPAAPPRVGPAQRPKVGNARPPKLAAKPKKESSSFCVLLDAGHGGLNPQGVYTTAPRKMYRHKEGKFHDGGVFYEGVFNRQILDKVADRLAEKQIAFQELSHDFLDTSLKARVSQANETAKQYDHCLLVSFHANAISAGLQVNDKVRGLEVFTSKQSSETSKSFAKVFMQKCKTGLGDQISYRGLKSARFYILMKTLMPAILVEHLFYDNYEDAKLLMNESIQDAFADAHLSAILAMKKELV